jgi:hypothetical protein
MAANITPLPQHRDFTVSANVANEPEDDPAVRKAVADGARIVADTDAVEMRRLAPSPSRVMMIFGGIAAVLLGGAVGYWLGNRSVARRTAKVRHAASTADSLVALAPVAAHLLRNPLVRTLAVRMVMRQLTSRLPG